MQNTLDRRAFLATGSLTLGTFLLDPAPAKGASNEAAPAVDDHYPAQDSESVREVVSVSHFSFERVRTLVDPRPDLAKAAWDWGFGDWESALGAAAHTGNREIALYLMEHGARPDLFTAAMLGDLETVRAFVKARPGIQSQPGPHGITLRRHAEVGGDAALPVLRYLDEVGGADEKPENLPLPTAKEAYLGEYEFEPGPNGRFQVILSRDESRLMLQRGEGVPRGLAHQGKNRFLPAGATGVEVRVEAAKGKILGLEVHEGGRVLSAVRVR